MPNHHTRVVPAISDEQRKELERWVRHRKTAQALAFWARILLKSAVGLSGQQVAGLLRTTRATVGKWRRRPHRPVGCTTRPPPRCDRARRRIR